MNEAEAWPVLIVGAGPTGLMLACELARRRVRCLVIEQTAGLFPGSRGKGLQPRTLEILEDLGVIQAIMERGDPFPPFRLYAGEALRWERTFEEMIGIWSKPTPSIPYPRPWLIPQWETDRILYEHCLALGGEVQLETKLVGFTQDEAGVRATVIRGGVTTTLRAQYLVGADGGRSRVRKLSGVAFAGKTYETERTLIGDVKVSGLEGEACHILTRSGDMKERFSLWNLPPSEHYQFVASMSKDEVPELSLKGVQQLLDERSGRSDLRLDDLRWISLYQVNVRMAERFRIGRVFLAGDAAHVHSSAGGQGLNTGVQDAYNLGWKLAAVLAGAGPGLLDTYEEERLPVAAHVLGLSSWLHHRGFQATPGATPALHQLDISYRGSSLAVDDRRAPGPLQAGDRAPDAILPWGSRLFDTLRGPHFTLLALGSPPLSFGSAVRVCHVDRLAGYELGEDPGAACFVLVRPDGYLGLITGELSRVHEYLRRVGAEDADGA